MSPVKREDSDITKKKQVLRYGLRDLYFGDVNKSVFKMVRNGNFGCQNGI